MRRRTQATIAPVAHWTVKEYAIARAHAKRRLTRLDVPRHLWPDIIDECLALAWSQFNDEKRRTNDLARFERWRDSIIAKQPDRADRLRQLDPRISVIRGLVTYNIRRAVAGARLVDTRPHRQYRDAMRPGNLDDFDARIEYLVEQHVQPVRDVAGHDPRAAELATQVSSRLAPSDRTILAWLARGWTAREIAREACWTRQHASQEIRAVRYRAQAVLDRIIDDSRLPARNPLPIPSMLNNYNVVPSDARENATIRERGEYVKPAADRPIVDHVHGMTLDNDGTIHTDTFARHVSRVVSNRTQNDQYVRIPDAWWQDPRIYMLQLWN